MPIRPLPVEPDRVVPLLNNTAPLLPCELLNPLARLILPVEPKRAVPLLNTNAPLSPTLEINPVDTCTSPELTPL